MADPQVVISFLTKPNIRTILATLGLHIPVILSERTDPTHRVLDRKWGLLQRWLYPYCHCLVVQSQTILSYFSARGQPRIRVIPNPVCLPPGDRSSGVGIGDKTTKTIIAMGRLREEKGFDLLLRAFARVTSQHPAWSLTIWGEGPLRASLERLRDELGLQHRVFLPGRTRHAFEEMRQADLFILSSRYEGFPNVLCEAMACGLPVISFDCASGPREIITDGVDGILVPSGEVAALSVAADRLMRDAEERRRLAHHARGVTKRFELTKVMALWEALVREAVQAGGGGRTWKRRSRLRSL
jgi:glycosyltransferase involved in cell wall biosynthesis